MIKVCVSGYFDPLHRGHLEYIKKARKYGDYLIVILNSDYQASLKKKSSFMDEETRKCILEELKSVDEVFLSIDKDRSVIKSLEKIRPNIFCNGGDQFNNDIPEKRICEKLNIKLIDGLGEKIDSSRNYLDKFNKVKY